MATARWHVDRLAEDIELLGGRGLPRQQYFAEVGERLRRVIDADALCWHTLDPRTALMTSDTSAELVDRGIFTAEEVPVAGQGIVHSEYVAGDFNSFAGLATKRIPVGILGEATHGDPARSGRYREVLEPAGIPFELRATFVSRGRTWGAVHVARRRGSGDFDRDDALALARVTGVIADGIRMSLRFDAARAPDGTGAPGLVVLGARDEVELITDPARELMALLRGRGSTGDTPPTAVLTLAAFCRRAEGSAHAVAVPGDDGWIT